MTRSFSLAVLLALMTAPFYALAQEEGAAESTAEAVATTEDIEGATPALVADEEGAVDEQATDEPVPEEPAEDGQAIDWGGVLERFPAFFAVMHRAAVHMPIALWVLGAIFVLVGLVVPSWRTQIPLACLVGGTLSSLPAAASGWWNAEHQYGDEWAFSDLTDADRFSEAVVQHRWLAVALVISSVILSIIALVNQRKKSVGLGFVWRAGLLALATAVAWEGHLGGELSVGEGFFNDAVDQWLGFEWLTAE